MTAMPTSSMPAVAHGESLRADHVLQAGLKRDVGVANRESFKDVIVGRHHVEQLVRAIAVEDRLRRRRPRESQSDVRECLSRSDT